MSDTKQVCEKIWKLIQSELQQLHNHNMQLYFTVVTAKQFGVVLPDWLRDRYPDRLTIILQNRFEDLKIKDDGFSVVLYFNDQKAEVFVPFIAIINFFNAVSGLVITIAEEGSIFTERKTEVEATAKKVASEEKEELIMEQKTGSCIKFPGKE